VNSGVGRAEVVSRQRARWIVLASGSTGLLIWLYDYDFFFNAGGPEAPISGAILKALHLETMEYPVPLLVPPIVLVLLGIAIGAIGIRLLRLFSR
jgi:hypothetical protein